jgi:hypothetical protein
MGVPGEARDRLDSWKAIADYLDRDVATVRRWEKSLGLPVRRVPGGPGRSVFAFRSEIDEWLKGAHLNGDASPSPQIAPLPEAPAGASASSRAARVETPGTHRRRWILGTAAVAVVAAIVVWRPWAPHAQGDTLTAELTDAAFIARAADGTERWRHPMPPGFKAVLDTSRSDRGIAPVDHGVPGFVAGYQYAMSLVDDSPRSGALFWLTRDGALHHSFRFADRLHFGAGTYEGPWVIEDYRTHPQLGPARLAVAARDYRWWPSVITVLDERWNRTQTFVNAGWVQRIAWLPNDRLLIVGFNNALDGAMVGLLDANAMRGHSPFTDDGSFTCAACGDDLPIRYIVLPRSEINRAKGSPFNRALLEVTRDRLVVRTHEEMRDSGQAPEALYEFSPELDVLSARYGDRYWDTHKALEMNGTLDHPRERCPERDGPPFMHVWDRDAGWRKIAR